MLSFLQKDVLIEILNTRIGYAASVISDISNKKIYLSVPNVELDAGSHIDSDYYITQGEITPGATVMATISFESEFNGNAFIFFPIDKAKMLVDACLGEMDINKDSCLTNLSFEDLDVIKELYNIIFNSILGEFSNMLDLRLNYTVPEVEVTTVSNLNKDVQIPEGMNVLSLYTSFSLSDSKINGVILIALTRKSVNMLIGEIDKMIEEVL